MITETISFFRWLHECLLHALLFRYYGSLERVCRRCRRTQVAYLMAPGIVCSVGWWVYKRGYEDHKCACHRFVRKLALMKKDSVNVERS